MTKQAWEGDGRNGPLTSLGRSSGRPTVQKSWEWGLASEPLERVALSQGESPGPAYITIAPMELKDFRS